jgi:hypothetical protein
VAGSDRTTGQSLGDFDFVERKAELLRNRLKCQPQLAAVPCQLVLPDGFG